MSYFCIVFEKPKEADSIDRLKPQHKPQMNNAMFTPFL